MRILFCVTNFGFLRNFQSALALLASRGHCLHLVADRTDSTGGMQMVNHLVQTYPSITFEIAPASKRQLWYALASGVRLSLDYWRYLAPRYRTAARLRARAERHAPRLAALLVRLPVLRTTAARRGLTWLFQRLERVIPSRPEVAALLARESPDVLVVTPLLYFGSQQVDHIRGARNLGIPSILAVGSWDHLTTKGGIHEIPDYVAVWNEMQKTEAIELHDVPADRILVTGAQAYDHWFEQRPSTTREEFCRKTGLPPEHPMLLYLCSSPFIAPYEVKFVRDWIQALRASTSERLRTAGILVRPHPQNSDQWRDVDLSTFGSVAIWPRGGANPIDVAAKSDYFDSMFHAHAVVGVNTSALIESGIVGRAVYSILAEQFSGTQEGTLHFQHLKNVEGGLLRLASTLAEHTVQIAGSLEAAPAVDPKVHAFVEAFVRPHGLHVAATPRLVEAIETIGAHGPRAAHTIPIGMRAGRVMVAPLAFVLMVLNIERDRWWSLLVHATRPPRLIVRAAASRAIFWRRAATRQLVHRARLMVWGARVVWKRGVFVPIRWVIRRVRYLGHVVLSAWRGEADPSP